MTDEFDNNLSNANFFSFFDTIPQILRVKASIFLIQKMFSLSGENVEEAFLQTARKIYQNIQDGSLELNAAESGVQHKPNPKTVPLGGGDSGGHENENCAKC